MEFSITLSVIRDPELRGTYAGGVVGESDVGLGNSQVERLHTDTPYSFRRAWWTWWLVQDSEKRGPALKYQRVN